jgi:DNA polymerase-1
MNEVDILTQALTILQRFAKPAVTSNGLVSHSRNNRGDDSRAQPSTLDGKNDDRCADCHVQMGVQLRLDGGFDFLCPRCGKSRDAGGVVEQRATLPTALDRFPGSISVIDAEFYAPPGHNPKHHCIGNHELRSDAASCTLCDDFNESPPCATAAGSLTVAYSGTQDLAGLIEAGYKLPENYIDAATETKLALNVPRLRKVPSLLEALDRFGIHHDITAKEKKKEGRRYNKPILTDADRRDVRVYCPNDCKLTSALFLRLLPDIEIDRALLFGEYIKENARIAFRGIPIDVAVFDKIQRNREQIRIDIIRRSPIGFEIYADDGTRNKQKIEAWIRKNGFEGWELTPKSGDPCLQENYLKKLVAGLSDENPEATNTIQQLIDLFSDLHDFDSPPFGIAPDGRTHADQRPFGASSGRNTPKHYVLNARKWWRWLIHPVKGSAIINFDFASEEPAIAAYLSGDQAMISAYEAGDMYQPVIDALGVSRKSAKACVLGVMYGRGAKALAEDEGVPYAEAERILRYHRDTYRAYWAWSDSVLETVKSKGIYELPDGWALRIDDSFKDSHEEQRTIRNFPIQGLGGCILRATVLAAAKENLPIIGTHHDSIVTESTLSKIDDQVKRMSQIMRETSAKFLHGKEIRVKPTVYEGRFEDADGAEDWQRISNLLKKYS